LEEGEVAHLKGTKQQKIKDPKDKRATSFDSREDVKVRRPQRIWAP